MQVQSSNGGALPPVPPPPPPPLYVKQDDTVEAEIEEEPKSVTDAQCEEENANSRKAMRNEEEILMQRCLLKKVPPRIKSSVKPSDKHKEDFLTLIRQVRLSAPQVKTINMADMAISTYVLRFLTSHWSHDPFIHAGCQIGIRTGLPSKRFSFNVITSRRSR